MPKQEVRRLLIVYEALGPMVAGGLALLLVAFVVSAFFHGAVGARLRVAGLSALGVLTAIGLFRSAIVMWKTRNLE